MNNYVNYILNEDYKELYQNEIKSFEIIVYEKYKPKKNFEKFLAFFRNAIKEQCPTMQIEVNYQVVETED